MNPEMMKFAQEQMARMSPDQIAAMQEQAKNMDAATMQRAMSQMNNMRPEDLQRARAQMSNMSPEDMMKAQKDMKSEDFSRRAEAMGSNLNAQAEYAYKASMQLKTDGNTLVGTGRHKEAVEKYKRAVNNMESCNHAGAAALLNSCSLNLALCYNKIGQYGDCVDVCTKIISQSGESLKAVFRRGQAHEGKGDLTKAYPDLKRAMELAPDDETVRDALKALEAKMAGSGVDDAALKALEAEAAEERKKSEAERKRKEDEAKASASSMASQADHVARAAAEMKKNPEMMKTMAEQIKTMDPEMIAKMSEMSGQPGMPKISAEQAKMAAEMMSKMSPEDMEAMAKLSQGMTGPGGVPDMNDPDMASKMAEKMSDPATRKMMSDMMGKLSAEDVRSMSRSMGKEMSEEEAEKAAAAMKNVSPEMMDKMMKAAGYLQKAYAQYKKLREKPMLMLGIALLFLAIFVRWMGW
eukprot:CAMPEP_0182864786 /NCGR_PEP_ID=MMETSP0034_2-20130328/7344_1 /TAXON_ID=156128 /ORGANISM="Nephroselmis pyriformis, Strain CCMP717" /LENGTH=465 /DNA_ID=CAMNT_0024997049 /DNA_START=122 /DNA_END=1516 /DNA_ORIENTATION=-